MASSDVSAVANYFASPNEGFATTLGSTISAGAVTVPLNSAAGLTNATIFVGIIEPGATNQQVFTGTVDTAGVQITGVKWTRGTNVGHAGGVAIVDYTTGTAFKMLTTGILQQHTQTGTHKGITTDTIATTGAATVGTTLGVTGATTISGALAVTGAISGNGYSMATMSNPYKFNVYLASNTAVVNAQVVPFDTRDFDTGSNVNISANKGRFTAPIAGFYFFSCTLSYPISGTSSTAYGIEFLKNQVTAYPANNLVNMYSGAFSISPQGSLFIKLSANDTMEIQTSCANTSSLNGGVNNSFFSGMLMAKT